MCFWLIKPECKHSDDEQLAEWLAGRKAIPNLLHIHLRMAAESTPTSMASVFNTKYEEFCRDLLGAAPELTAQITAAAGLLKEDRIKRFRQEVLQHSPPNRDKEKCPSCILPGVVLPEQIWSQLSEKSKTAIQEYLTLLSFCCLMEDPAGLAGATEGGGWTEGWAKSMMDDLKAKMDSIDFGGLSEKIAKLFGTDPNGIPQIPEKFLKGQIAKLAEEIVKEFKIEDLGLDPAEAEAAGNDPTKALNLIMGLFQRNPQVLQQTMMRLTKKLQAKIQSGALRPQELVAEAEELMKTFKENPAFVEMMESFRSAFGMEDPDLARATGNDGSGRLAMARARLRKKLEAKKAGKR